jgi:hypothetical protein
MAEYIRFSTFNHDSLSKRPQGVFQALFDLKDNGQMQEHHLIHFENTVSWFNKNLKKPTQFSKSKKRHALSSGICWYKASAHTHINKMYELVDILKEHLIEVNITKTNKPGYIVYDDDFQIVAEPFVETKGHKLK